jgi:hypothetical protein
MRKAVYAALGAGLPPDPDGLGADGTGGGSTGATWTVRALGYSLNAVAYGNGAFVAVGRSGIILTSP